MSDPQRRCRLVRPDEPGLPPEILLQDETTEIGPVEQRALDMLRPADPAAEIEPEDVVIAIAMVAREVDRTSDLLMRHVAASARAVESTIETLETRGKAPPRKDRLNSRTAEP